jgi:hypothetical protein
MLRTKYSTVVLCAGIPMNIVALHLAAVSQLHEYKDNSAATDMNSSTALL